MNEILRSPLFMCLATGALIVLGTSFLRHWSQVRRTAIEADLKLEMVRQGMSADEICRVVEARPCSAWSRRRHREFA
jgi:hypothetical protein